MDDRNDSPSEVDYALERLERISTALRNYSQLLVMITLVNLVITMLLLSGLHHILQFEVRLGLSVLPIASGITAVMLAFLFDSLKRDGDAYFEELSDELHGKRLNPEFENFARDASLRARVTIRRYSNAASIPLIPGNYGPAIIAAANIVFSFFAAVIGSRVF